MQLAAQDLDAEARDRVRRFAENTTPLNEHGTNQHGLDNYKVLSMATSSIDGGTDSEYLTARIARDRPDILERMKAGRDGEQFVYHSRHFANR